MCVVRLLLFAAAVAASKPRVAILPDGALPAPARYGLAKLESALKIKGIEVAAGPADLYVLAGLRSAGACKTAPAAAAAEALSIRKTTHKGKAAVVLCGADARGLEYAALDTAARVAWSADAQRPFLEVRDTAEQPYLSERSVSMYTMQRAYFESRLYDRRHWERYFDLLAASRINRFVVIFGYENGGFMAPPYPYFFNVEQFPDVTLVGLTEDARKRNVEAFRAMIAAAHARGIDFVAAIWDHIYRGGVQGGGIEGASSLVGRRVPGLVWGVTGENLAPYTKAALTKFLQVFPDLDGIQLRMHGESGLKREEMEGFWHEVFSEIKRVRPGFPVELRAKDLPDSIIHDAQQQGLRVRVSTKYWMEQMGMPFHPTHVNKQNQRDRRHGYADLLRYPQTYKVHWQLWSGGTARLLLWGDPEYVRRFAGSAKLYRGESFDVNEMLATKMLGEPHDATPVPILNERYRHYEYEFERYWHFYQLWGRLTYNPDTPAETWEREFARRFAGAGAHVMRGLHLASRVLPRIVAASYPYQFFPTTRGWAEMMRMGDLPSYSREHATDTVQFLSAREVSEGTEKAGRPPDETSQWFAQIAAQILEQVELARKAGGSGKEFLATITDLKILAGLARYHSHRLRAAVDYSFGDIERAVTSEKEAVAAWEGIVAAAGDVYNEQLPFGVHRVGFSRHWKEELEKLRRGLAALEKERGRPLRERRGPVTAAPAAGVRLPRPAAATPGQDLRVTAEVAGGGARRIRLHYRHVTQFEDYQSVDMAPRNGVYEAVIPASFVVPEWDVMYYVEAGGRLYPDLETETPYVVVSTHK